METSMGVALSLLGKRRAEAPNPDDSGESKQTADEEGVEEELDEEGVEFDRESYRNKENSELEWGYDSFETKELSFLLYVISENFSNFLVLGYLVNHVWFCWGLGFL